MCSVYFEVDLLYGLPNNKLSHVARMTIDTRTTHQGYSPWSVHLYCDVVQRLHVLVLEENAMVVEDLEKVENGRATTGGWAGTKTAA